MRDYRFVAVHRGGPLNQTRHRLLASWAAACAEHVLPLFEAESTDIRPGQAIAIARLWAKGKIPVGDAQKAALSAHAAARAAKTKPAIAAARAAGHAAATAHMAEHSLGAVIYGLKAVKAEGSSNTRELAWQIKKLPVAVRALVLSALESPRFKSVMPKREGPQRGSKKAQGVTRKRRKELLTST